MTPIAGYLSAIRSVVVGAATRRSAAGSWTRTRRWSAIDGREDVPIAVGDVVEVRALRAARSASSSREGALPFWDLLRHKVELLPS